MRGQVQFPVARARAAQEGEDGGRRRGAVARLQGSRGSELLVAAISVIVVVVVEVVTVVVLVVNNT